LYSYDINGNKVSETSPLGRVTRYEYNGFNRLTGVTEPSGLYTRYTYDKAGNKTYTRKYATKNGLLLSVTQQVYNEMGQVLRKSDSLVSATGGTNNNDVLSFRYTYDLGGNVILTTRSRNTVAVVTYNQFNEPIISRDRLGNTTRTTYDARGLKTEEKFVTASGTTQSTKQYEYTADGKVAVSKALSSTGTIDTRVTYNELGYPTSSTDGLGRVTHFVADYQGKNLITQYLSDTGGLTEVKNGYDNMGRQTSVQDENGNITRMEYDSFGNLSKKIYADGNEESYVYDIE